MTEVTTELGFSVKLADVQRLRGQYDASRLSEPVKLAIAGLLALPGVKVDTIAKELGVSWEVVVAVRESSPEAIREFRDALSKRLESVIGLALPALLDQAREGKLNVFDLSLLIDRVLLLRGEATSRVEHVTAKTPLHDWLESGVPWRDVTPGMGSSTEKLPAIAAEAEPVTEPAPDHQGN